ncbi:MAG TPA: hypothetical protein VEM40_05430 [Nitrospirota bacterium]|nr:hypothetical protein [Nitrospirota bacterium]
MDRTLSCLFISLLILTGAACSGAKKPLGQSAIQSNKVLASLQDMSRAFEKKEPSAFMGKIANAYKDRQAFAASIESVLAKYDTVRFTIQYTKMLITVEEHGMTKVAFNWDSEWRTAGGSVQKNSGRSTFVFDPREATLVSIDGKNPFIPQPVGEHGEVAK